MTDAAAARRTGRALPRRGCACSCSPAARTSGATCWRRSRRDAASVELIAASSVCDEPALFDFDAVHRVPPGRRRRLRSRAAAHPRRRADRPRHSVPRRGRRVRRRLARPASRSRAAAARRQRGDRADHRRQGREPPVLCRPRPAVRRDDRGVRARRAGRVRRAARVPDRHQARARLGVDGRGARQHARAARPRARAARLRRAAVPRRPAHDGRRSSRRGSPTAFRIRHDFQGVKQTIQALVAPDGRVAGVFAMESARSQRTSKRTVVSRAPDTIAIGRARGRGVRGRRLARPAESPVSTHRDGRRAHPRVQRSLHRCDGRPLAARLRRGRHGDHACSPAARSTIAPPRAPAAEALRDDRLPRPAARRRRTRHASRATATGGVHDGAVVAARRTRIVERP